MGIRASVVSPKSTACVPGVGSAPRREPGGIEITTYALPLSPEAPASGSNPFETYLWDTTLADERMR